MKIRNLKVEKTGDFHRHQVKPAIRLKGNWLARAGFAPDSRVRVIVRETGWLEVLADGHHPTPLSS